MGGKTGEEFSFTENLQSIRPRSNKYQPNVIKKQFDTMLRQVNAKIIYNTPEYLRGDEGETQG
jgi:hypothetical protein